MHVPAKLPMTATLCTCRFQVAYSTPARQQVDTVRPETAERIKRLNADYQRLMSAKAQERQFVAVQPQNQGQNTAPTAGNPRRHTFDMLPAPGAIVYDKGKPSLWT